MNKYTLHTLMKNLAADGCIEGTIEGMLAIHRPTHDIFSGRGILSKRTTRYE